MCDQRVVLLDNGEETLVLESVERMEMVDDGMRVMNIFGEEKVVKAVFHSWSNNTMVLHANPVSR